MTCAACVHGDECMLCSLSHATGATADHATLAGDAESDSDADNAPDGARLLSPPPPPRQAKLLAYSAFLCDVAGVPLPAPVGNEVEITSKSKVKEVRWFLFSILKTSVN